MRNAEEIIRTLASVQGDLSVNEGVIWLEDGTSIDISWALPEHQITITGGPKEEFPYFCVGGLYIQIQSAEGRLIQDQIHTFTAPIATENGYDASGRTTIQGNTKVRSGPMSYTIWFHDKNK